MKKQNRSNPSRRDLLKTAAASAAVTMAAPAIVRGQNLNDKIRVVVVGMGGRANAHAESLVDLEKESTAGIEFAGVCDCDEAKRKSAEAVWGAREAVMRSRPTTTCAAYWMTDRSML